MSDAKRQALPIFAQSFVGISQSDPSGLALISEFRRSCGNTQDRPTAWCLSFAMFCIKAVDRMFGGDATILPTTEWTVGLCQQIKFDPFRVPQIGDLGLFQEMQTGGALLDEGHALIVSAVDGTSNIASVEGNTSLLVNGNQRASGCIAEKIRENGQIAGFLRRGFVSPWA